MNRWLNKTLIGLIVYSVYMNCSFADQPETTGISMTSHGVRADSHAPIGVMGEHMHRKGEWMLSYRYMKMDMDGSQNGKNDISPEETATTIANPFFGMPMQPPTLRVVPTQMTMKMHMLGFMYAPSDWLTLMAMASYLQKDMNHITFMGGMGTTILGGFETRSSGIGDTKVSGMIKIYEDDTHHLHANAGVSLPTGSITEKDDVLTPMGTTPRLRMPYPMQLGSGTFDLIPGITYTGKSGPVGWGAQYSSMIRLGESDEDYTLGDEHRLTGWMSYLFSPWISVSGRLAGQTIGKIEGRDSRIVAPVQTADPDNQGGDRIDFLIGVNLAAQSGIFRGQRLAAEFGVPIHQNLNGPQLETDWLFTLGYQYSF